MKFRFLMKHGTTDILKTIKRYPITMVFLLGAWVINVILIEGDPSVFLEKLLVTFMVGAMFTVLAMLINETFFHDRKIKVLTIFLALVLTGGYYFLMRNMEGMNVIVAVRTGVITPVFMIAYFLIPSTKKDASVDLYLVSTVKAFFTALLFSGVLFLGVSVIIGTINQLLFSVNASLYAHFANLIFVIFAPVFFLSIPHRFEIPKFFENLLTYVMIPLFSLFTFILVLYILSNLREDFWRDNLLEPMLVSYSVVFIFMYFLVSPLDKRLAIVFKGFFPKIIIVIFLFQTIASALMIQETGLTHGRYYAILYGVFSVMAALSFSINQEKMNHRVAMLLILFSVISLIPPVDAFTLSLRSQQGRVEEVLSRNEMYWEDEIAGNQTLGARDQSIIAEGVRYLYELEAINRLDGIPEGFEYYRDFEEVFGFSQYRGPFFEETKILSYHRRTNEPIEIEGYQMIIPFHFSNDEWRGMPRENGESEQLFQLNEKKFRMSWNQMEESLVIVEDQAGGIERIRLRMEDVLEHLPETTSGKTHELNLQEASIYLESKDLKVLVIVNHLELFYQGETKRFYGEVWMLLSINEDPMN